MIHTYQTTRCHNPQDHNTKKTLKSSIFWVITPCSTLKVNRRFGEISSLHLQGTIISRVRNQRESRSQAELCFRGGFLVSLFLVLKTEPTYSSETSADFQRTRRRYIPEDKTLRNHRCENLTPYKENTVSK
jgi:hypothetical protein